ncbi:MAG: flagellin [Hyphomonadaceae bacterium]|nr:flagellin [Hyphomonadaceae bacterium]
MRFSSQAMLDVRRITQSLTDMQRQIASGYKHEDLSGFGGAASRLVSAQGLRASAEARISVANQLDARFGVQAAALNAVSNSADSLSQTLRDAISASDGRGIATELSLAFSSIVGALNETWNGQPMFAGERTNGVPIKITTLEELQAATGPEDIFNEAERHQIIDMGVGAPIQLASKASELATDLFNTLLELKNMVDAAGGEIGAPLSETQMTMLQDFAVDLEREARTFTVAEARAGQLQKRFTDEQARLQSQSNLLTKEVGEMADADVGEVTVQLNSLLTQYQATAKTFAELSQLSLLDYL